VFSVLQESRTLMNDPITLVALTGPKDDRPALVPLRALEPTDLPELRRAQKHAYADAPELPGTPWGQTADPEVHGAVIQEASLVASGPGRQITAAIIVTERDGTAVITELFTHPDHRRQGLAEELLREALHVLHTLEHGTVTVSVDDTNSAALALYLSRDFRRLVGAGEDDDVYA
jgi:ribosomal protein S18 acetylase RimI-like enzyme